MSFVDADQPRIRQALGLFHSAFVCLSAFLPIRFAPEPWQADLLKVAIASCGMGAALLAGA